MENKIKQEIKKIVSKIGEKTKLSKSQLLLLKNINNVLFSDFSGKNVFKFDISFDVNYSNFQEVRFSYNDKSERKKDWVNKIKKVFFLNKSSIKDRTLNKIKKFPLTLGLSWGKNNKFPNLKIYVESDYQEIKKFIASNKIISPSVKNLLKQNNLSTISFGIVCSPERKKIYKLYFRDLGFKSKNYFRLLGINFSARKVLSKKFYIIYETSEFYSKKRNFNLKKRYFQIGKLLNSFQKKNVKNKLSFLSSLIDKNFFLYPIAYSFNENGLLKLYLSLMKKYV